MSARDPSDLLSVVHPAVRRTAVVLLHGLCSTPDEMLTVQSALRGNGYSVHPLQIDGYSFDAAAPMQHAVPYERWLDAIQARVQALRTQHERVMLVGISAGSSLALGAAIRCGSDVDALVLMSTTLRFDGWAIPRTQVLLPLAFYTPLGRLWQYRERPPYGVKNERVRAWIERELRHRKVSRAGSSVIGVAHLREHDRLIRHVRRNLHRVQCASVLALHARDDEVASVANLDILARGLRCKAFRSVVLTDSYHMITIDNDRHQVVRETVAFADAIAHGMPGIPGAPSARLPRPLHA
jgi:carboxylesterase